ncbi:hypothetical protein K474DRAFT_913250 [Panus rudis PR-1116 ss-1]|nr:hypothetical protein K474DRAFT_913250 [Panus rudis PR-1116 ss-1]
MPVITRTIAVSGDAIVLYFTLKQTWSIVRDAKGLKIKQTLGALLLRNGALQFSILLSLNVVTIILATLAIGANITSSATAFVYVANAGSSITVSRFLLNLRTIYFAASDGTRNGEETQKTSTIKWGSIVGNIGAPLDSLFDDTDGTAGDDPDSAVEDSDSQKVYSQNPLSDGLMQLWETEEKAP